MTTNAFPTPGSNFVHELQDIETLNHRAMNQDLEVSAVSIHAYPDIADHYALMNCGASMGEGYGPMIVCKEGVSEEEARNNVIAVPGLKTSAYLGLRLAWGDCEVAVVPFDEIIPESSMAPTSAASSSTKVNSPMLTMTSTSSSTLANGGMREQTTGPCHSGERRSPRPWRGCHAGHHQIHQNEHRVCACIAR